MNDIYPVFGDKTEGMTLADGLTFGVNVDDVGLSALKQKMALATVNLAKALDQSISAYVEMIEGRPVWSSGEVPGTIGPIELSTNGFKIELQTCPPDGWGHFFVWKMAASGTVFAWRVAFVERREEHAVLMDTTLQTITLGRDQWPDGLKRFLAGKELSR